MKAAAIDFKTTVPESAKAALVALCLLLLLAAVVFGITRQSWRAAGDSVAPVRQEETQNVQDIDPFALPGIGNAYLTGA